MNTNVIPYGRNIQNCTSNVVVNWICSKTNVATTLNRFLFKMRRKRYKTDNIYEEGELRQHCVCDAYECINKMERLCQFDDLIEIVM